MKEIINEMKSKVNQMLEDIKIANMNIEYILVDTRNLENSQAVVISEDGEIGYQILPYQNDIKNILDWDYSIDEYVFGELENGNVIAYMSDEMHLVIWNDIDKYYPEDMNHKNGVQKYLKYCKENEITKEYLEKTTNQKDFEDVMKYHKIKNDRER